MNKDDSERIAGILTDAGFAEAVIEDDADIIIFNTCSIRQNADEKLYGQAAALKQLKAARPELLIAIGGCLAQLDSAGLRKRLPHVDVVFGTHNIRSLPELLHRAEADKGPVCEILDRTADFNSDLPASRKHLWHAWLPITVGCDNFCTYCVVPYVRGREKSRSLDRLTAETADLVGRGVKEITLLGQNVNSYGRDLYGEPKFASLLKRVAEVKGVDRIRFTTSHPKDLNNEVIDIVAQAPNVCSHFHLPLQSGSDRILNRMNRRYSSKEYLKIVETIRARVDGVSITTDIMVAFPGETEEDFQATLDVVALAGFDQAFTFIYSPRQGTAAAGYKDQVPADRAAERFDRLLEVQNRNAIAGNRRLLGNRVTVFIEGHSKKSAHRLAARTSSNKLVHVDGADALIGKTLDVKIKEAFSWFLIGEAV